jgi:Tfp pilus assembly protein PilZ
VPENRQHPRKSIESPVAFQVEGGARIEASCRDISLGGVYVETEAPLPYGAALTLFIRLPGFGGEAAIASIVRWNKPNGMGVQFGRMGARETHALTQLLAAGG